MIKSYKIVLHKSKMEWIKIINLQVHLTFKIITTSILEYLEMIHILIILTINNIAVNLIYHLWMLLRTKQGTNWTIHKFNKIIKNMFKDKVLFIKWTATYKTVSKATINRWKYWAMDLKRKKIWAFNQFFIKQAHSKILKELSQKNNLKLSLTQSMKNNQIIKYLITNN